MADKRASDDDDQPAKKRRLGEREADDSQLPSYGEMDLDGDIDDASLLCAVDHIEKTQRPLPRVLVRQINGDFLCKTEHDRNLLAPRCREERNPLEQVVLILSWTGESYLQPPSFKEWVSWNIKNTLKSEAKWQLEHELKRNLDPRDGRDGVLLKERLDDLARPWLASLLPKMVEEIGVPLELTDIKWEIEHRMMIRSPDHPNRFVEADDLRRRRPGAFVMARDIFVQDGQTDRHFQDKLRGNFDALPCRISQERKDDDLQPPARSPLPEEKKRKEKPPLLLSQALLLGEMRRATAEAFSDPGFPWPPDTPPHERAELAKQSRLRSILEVSDDLMLRFGLRLTVPVPRRDYSEPSTSDSEDELPIETPQAIFGLPRVNRHGIPTIRQEPESLAASPSQESASTIGASQSSLPASQASTPPSSQISVVGRPEPSRARTDRDEDRSRRSPRGR